jgi:hypothetical protein
MTNIVALMGFSTQHQDPEMDEEDKEKMRDLKDQRKGLFKDLVQMRMNLANQAAEVKDIRREEKEEEKGKKIKLISNF